MHCSAVLAVQHARMQSACACCRANTTAAQSLIITSLILEVMTIFLCTGAVWPTQQFNHPNKSCFAKHAAFGASSTPLFMCRTFIQDPVIAAYEHSLRRHAVDAYLDAELISRHPPTAQAPHTTRHNVISNAKSALSMQQAYFDNKQAPLLYTQQLSVCACEQ